MKCAIWANVVVAMVAARGWSADSCCGCQCPMPPITLVNQPPPPPPRQGPNVMVPAPVLYHMQVSPPVAMAAPPARPIVLFEKPAPPIHVYELPPPQVSICNAVVRPPLYAEMPARPGIVIFDRTLLPAQNGPTIVQRPLTLVEQPQPPAPCNLGRVCNYCNGGPTVAPAPRSGCGAGYP